MNHNDNNYLTLVSSLLAPNCGYNENGLKCNEIQFQPIVLQFKDYGPEIQGKSYKLNLKSRALLHIFIKQH